MLPKSDPYLAIRKHSEEYKQEARNNIIRELVETERNYVRHCETLQVLRLRIAGSEFNSD